MKKSKLNITIFNCVKSIVGSKSAKWLLFKLYKSHYLEKNIIFVHIPKSAGTSISNALYGKRLGHFEASELQKFLGSITYQSLYSFSVTRNPYDRLVSAYFYAKQGGSPEGSVNNPQKYQTHPFRSFESFVKEWLRYQNMEKIELLFRPQHLFLYERNRLLVNYVGKIEELTEVEIKIGRKLNRKLNFSRLNESIRSKEYEDYYTSDIRKIVSDIYIDDFRLFNYEV